MRIIFIFTFLLFYSYASNLESLLKQYEDSSKNSLETLNEKMGHVVVYTQEELQHMQYNNLSDVLRELPTYNLNVNKFGLNTISLAGSKTDVIGFFRLYINDHEVSSVYNESPSLGWLEMPVSIIDHIEVYYGEGSFTLGNATGVQFIRVYTKNAKKENGNEVELIQSSKSSNQQSFTHSGLLENAWSYLLHFTNKNSFSQKEYNNEDISNDSKQQYFFLNLNNDSNSIDLGYTKLQKDTYTGYTRDFISDDGNLKSDNLFIHTNSYFLNDKSLKLSLSYDLSNIEYKEFNNDQRLFIVPLFDFANFIGTTPKYFSEKIKLQKMNAYLSKEFKLKDHNFFTAINIKNKKYKTINRKTINFFNVSNDVDKFYDFDEETIYSLMLKDDYEITHKLHFITNYKIDKYQRSGSVLEDSLEHMYRFGAIYLPTENLGFKSFFTKSYIPPTFYNIDYAKKSDIDIKTQQYKYFNLEGVYSQGNSRFSIDYFKVYIDNFVYYSPIGFINIEDKVKTYGYIFDYEYELNKNHKIKLNYFLTRLNQDINNSNEGGYIKYMGKTEKFDYFTSLIYKNDYKYKDVSVDESFNLNLGFTYNYNKNLSFSIEGRNLLDKPTNSLVNNGLNNQNIALEDYDRSVVFALRWLF